MADSHDDAIVPETPKKNKGGRPRKVKAPESGAILALVEEQAKKIADLQSMLLAQGAQAMERQKATLDPIPPASDERKPGSYVVLGRDSSGAPIMGKVRWTKQAIEETYPPVTFVPMRDFTCGPHGIVYRVEPGKQTTVPSIVHDLYVEALRVEKEMEDRYKPWSAMERAELDARAAEAPGVGQRSRLARVGGGLNVHAADDAAASVAAAKAQQ